MYSRPRVIRGTEVSSNVFKIDRLLSSIKLSAYDFDFRVVFEASLPGVMRIQIIVE